MLLKERFHNWSCYSGDWQTESEHQRLHQFPRGLSSDDVKGFARPQHVNTWRPVLFVCISIRPKAVTQHFKLQALLLDCDIWNLSINSSFAADGTCLYSNWFILTTLLKLAPTVTEWKKGNHRAKHKDNGERKPETNDEFSWSVFPNFKKPDRDRKGRVDKRFVLSGALSVSNLRLMKPLTGRSVYRLFLSCLYLVFWNKFFRLPILIILKADVLFAWLVKLDACKLVSDNACMIELFDVLSSPAPVFCTRTYCFTLQAACSMLEEGFTVIVTHR